MVTATLGCRSFYSSSTWAGSSLTVRMCRLVLLVTFISINIHASSQIPPRLHSCRTRHKARGPEEFTLPTSESCGFTVLLPLPNTEVINATDPRNCANFYKCSGYTCQHCPCPDGMTFNPVALKCDSTNSQCVCQVETTTPQTTTVPTTTKPATKMFTTPSRFLVKTADQDPQNSNNAATTQKPVSTEVIIIAGIVSATVIVIVVIVMGVFCWQRRHTTRQSTHTSKPKTSTAKRLSTTKDEAYSTSIPPTEKHEYAEIDERMINGRKHWQHGGSLRAPPLPNHQPPPTSPTCPHHHTRSDSGLGSADTSFTANYPRRTFQPINPAHSIKIGVAYNERPQASTCCCDETYHGREDSSASSDSQYSNSSNAVSVDSRDVDMRTPLHHGKQNYMSKQVYI